VIARTRGLDLAAALIERAFQTNQRVNSAGERAELSRV
jgi:hypothetical protein